MADQPAIKVTAPGNKRLPQANRRERKAPKVATRKKGRINQALDGFAEQYEKQNPGRSAQWVYSPAHNPELSNIMSRRSQGYRPVDASELGSDSTYQDDEGEVRVGDLLLMSIADEEREEILQEKRERAEDQIQSVEADYYDNITSLGNNDHGRPRMSPAGRSVIEKRDHEYEYHQREEED